jgi:BirA family biotin operon repressor/biotin-[acetyl-CoA-carboxylase] ligase
VESTQPIARQLAEEGASEGTTVVAAEQTGGRGRLGNSFFSPPGGLYASVVLRPRIKPPQAPLIGLAAGLGLAEGVAAAAGVRPVLKWPNDLLLNGRKLSGLLVDLAAGRDGVRYAILGVGINVNLPEEAFPPELRHIATSLLRESARKTPLDEVLSAVCAGLAGRYTSLQEDGPQDILAAWRAWPNMLGGRIRVSRGVDRLEGVAEDLAEDGALLLRLSTGEQRRVLAADVHLLRD